MVTTWVLVVFISTIHPAPAVPTTVSAIPGFQTVEACVEAAQDVLVFAKTPAVDVQTRCYPTKLEAVVKGGSK